MSSHDSEGLRWRTRGQVGLVVAVLVAVGVTWVPGLADKALVAVALGFVLGMSRR